MESVKVPWVKKAKKKQVKDELDRFKQAEKKRRRLEKALATSAAIRSELEKKKQQKKEEQRRLDEEGAAIAEAVALHVLLGEDSDDTPQIILKRAEDTDDWQRASGVGLFMDGAALCHKNYQRCSFEGIGHLRNAYRPGSDWNNFGESSRPFSPWPLDSNFRFPYLGYGNWSPKANDISAGYVAALAVSTLQIGEDAQVDAGFFSRY